MTGKWTPKPWHACAGDDCPELLSNGKRLYFPHVHIGPKVHDTVPKHITINDVSVGLATLEEHDANARLIAKAPELVEVLHDLLQVAGHHSWAHITNGPCSCKSCTIDKAQALLKELGAVP